MTDIDRIFRELVDLHDQRLNAPADDYATRANIAWRRHQLHAEAAQISQL